MKERFDILFDVMIMVTVAFSFLTIISFLSGAVVDLLKEGSASTDYILNAILAMVLVFGISFFYIKIKEMGGENEST